MELRPGAPGTAPKKGPEDSSGEEEAGSYLQLVGELMAQRTYEPAIQINPGWRQNLAFWSRTSTVVALSLMTFVLLGGLQAFDPVVPLLLPMGLAIGMALFMGPGLDLQREPRALPLVATWSRWAGRVPALLGLYGLVLGATMLLARGVEVLLPPGEFVSWLTTITWATALGTWLYGAGEVVLLSRSPAAAALLGLRFFLGMPLRTLRSVPERLRRGYWLSSPPGEVRLLTTLPLGFFFVHIWAIVGAIPGFTLGLILGESALTAVLLGFGALFGMLMSSSFLTATWAGNYLAFAATRDPALEVLPGFLPPRASSPTGARTELAPSGGRVGDPPVE